MADFYLKAADTKPDLTATLLDAAGVAVNLTGATVEFAMKKNGGSSTKVSAAATLVTPSAGTVKYVWQSADTDTPGDYNAEFEVTFGDGTVLTFPNSGYFTINIAAEIV